MATRERVAELIRQGREHYPTITAYFVDELDQYPIDALIAGLPSTCRAMAEEIVADARRAGISDNMLAEAATTAYQQQGDARAVTPEGQVPLPRDPVMEALGFPPGVLNLSM